jgi:hypothetical protein
MVRFIAACAAGGASLSTSKILGSRKFLAAEIDHVMT